MYTVHRHGQIVIHCLEPPSVAAPPGGGGSLTGTYLGYNLTIGKSNFFTPVAGWILPVHGGNLSPNPSLQTHFCKPQAIRGDGS